MKVGDPAPDFELPADPGERLALKDLRGKTVVLFFYSKDFTSGWTREAEAFRDVFADLKKVGAVPVGVSKDSLQTHKKFRDKYKLPYPLVSDPDKKVLEAYGAWGTKTMYGKKVEGTLRSTVIVDAMGKVKKIFPRVKVEGHADAVLEFLRTT